MKCNGNFCVDIVFSDDKPQQELINDWDDIQKFCSKKIHSKITCDISPIKDRYIISDDEDINKYFERLEKDSQSK